MSNPPTRCGEIGELLGAYALGALEGDEQAMVAAHLTRCAPCRSERDDLARVVELLDKARPIFAADTPGWTSAYSRHLSSLSGRTEEQLP